MYRTKHNSTVRLLIKNFVNRSYITKRKTTNTWNANSTVIIGQHDVREYHWILLYSVRSKMNGVELMLDARSLLMKLIQMKMMNEWIKYYTYLFLCFTMTKKVVLQWREKNSHTMNNKNLQFLKINFKLNEIWQIGFWLLFFCVQFWFAIVSAMIVYAMTFSKPIYHSILNVVCR